MTRAPEDMHIPGLDLGSNVVELLLPHRRPLLLVDRILAFSDADPDPPVLFSSRHISGNEAVFEGHFPGLHLWPGIYVIEGLGQSCYLLSLLVELRRQARSRGDDPELVLTGLRDLERGTRLRRGFDPEALPHAAGLGNPQHARIGVSSAVDVKLVHPVFAGCRLDYRVAITRSLGDHVRYSVEALVEGERVAKGSLSSFIGHPYPGKVWPR